MQALDGIIANAFNAGGELGVEVFTFHSVAGDDGATACRERCDKIALQIHALREVFETACREALKIDVGALLPRGIAEGIGQESLGMEPSGFEPGWREPTGGRARRRDG